MALEGQLNDFNLAEILQLLASQQKSGFLNIETNRKMVFVFDRGSLISTRDRRNRARDPLESFLRAYGFFDEKKWKHIDYIRQNSSLDLTEILISESLLSQSEMERALKSLAQEMIHAGMKLRRGRYHFSPTKDTPPGVKHRYHLDVQGLLMEAARRLDEEPGLKEALPSQAISFSAGQKALPSDELGEIGQRIMELALAGLPLGRIIRQGRTESFVVRDLLKNWCDDGVLVMHHPDDLSADDDASGGSISLKLSSGLRSLPVTIVILLMLGALAWWRWQTVPATGTTIGDDLRVAQLRSEVVTAAQLYRYQQGEWPENLHILVRGGQLAPSILYIVEDLGWRYERDHDLDAFRLET